MDLGRFLLGGEFCTWGGRVVAIFKEISAILEKAVTLTRICHISTWHTELAPAVLAAVKTEFSYVIIRHHNIGYIPIWITSCHFLIV